MSTPPDPRPRLGTADDAAAYVDITSRFLAGDIDRATYTRLMKEEWSGQRTLLPNGLFDAIVDILRSMLPNSAPDPTIAQELIDRYAELKRREAVGEHRGSAWTLPDGRALYDVAAVPQGTTAEVIPYLDIVHAFVSGEIDAQRYEVEFVDLWRQQRFFLPDGMDAVMEQLFYANQDFVRDDHLRERGELDADQFRARVAELEPELVARFEDARRREAEGPAGV